jgi:hypothetical protein
MRFIFLVIFLNCCMIAPGCKHSQVENYLKEGDLLFQNLGCGALCEAIEAVTEGIDKKKFSHCALVVNINDTLRVVEAIGNKVQVNTLLDFFSRSGDTIIIRNITIGRVKHNFENLIPAAVSKAKQLIGQPYDDEFILDNNKWYCSELIYHSFKEANQQKDFFTLEPMTFKDPLTNDYFKAWVDYYKQLNTDIPEGKPGINPGLISRSDKIQIININSYQ